METSSRSSSFFPRQSQIVYFLESVLLPITFLKCKVISCFDVRLRPNIHGACFVRLGRFQFPHLHLYKNFVGFLLNVICIVTQLYSKVGQTQMLADSVISYVLVVNM